MGPRAEGEMHVQDLSYPVVYLVAQLRGCAVARSGMVHSNNPKERVKAFHGVCYILGHLLYHYIGDAIAPDTKTDATLDSGTEEAASVRLEPDIKQYDALDDWKGEGGEKKKQKGEEEEENGGEAKHDEVIREESN